MSEEQVGDENVAIGRLPAKKHVCQLHLGSHMDAEVQKDLLKA